MSLHADEGNGFPLTRLHHFPAALRATNLQLPIAVILSNTIYTKLDAITLALRLRLTAPYDIVYSVSLPGEVHLFTYT